MKRRSISLAEFLRAARLTAGLTQVELAKKLGCTSTYVSHLECGKKKEPSLKMLKGIAKATGTNVCIVITVGGKVKAL